MSIVEGAVAAALMLATSVTLISVALHVGLLPAVIAW